MRSNLMKSFGGARARHNRKSAKFNVMLILLFKHLRILSVLVDKPVHNLGMVVDAVVCRSVIRIGRNQKSVRPKLVVTSESSVPRKVLNGTRENPSDAISSKLIAKLLRAVTMKSHSVEPLGEKILNSFLAGDIGTSAFTVLRNLVVDSCHTDGISVKWNHS